MNQVGRSRVATVTEVNDVATNVTLLAANTQRTEAIIWNDSTSILYIKFGAVASLTSNTARLAQNDTFRTNYTGRIDGIWSVDSTGLAHITETV